MNPQVAPEAVPHAAGMAVSSTFQGAPGSAAGFAGSDGAGGPPVYGQVRQGDGVPVSGVTVTLIEASGRQAGRSRTDMDGSYQVRVARPGSYTLVAMAAGHQPQAAMVHAGAGPVEHDVLLAGEARLAGTVRAAGRAGRFPVLPSPWRTRAARSWRHATPATKAGTCSVSFPRAVTPLRSARRPTSRPRCLSPSSTAPRPPWTRSCTAGPGWKARRATPAGR